jgi:N-acetylmuramoyl-L-alanine amidase
MTFSLQSSLGLIFAALIVSCAAPDNRSSLGRDVYGHRPGPQGFRTVIIDAGHGGKDSGAVSAHTGQKEKDLALDTAKRIANELRGEFKVILMRSDDSFIDLDERVIRANRNGDAILISMHYNWRVDSHGLATRFQQAMASASPAESGNRGLVRRRIRLTRNPEIPCVLLEGGYLSNAAEARLISNPGYRQKLASNIAAAIRTQAAVGDRGTGPLPHPINAPPSRPTDAPE